MEIAPKRRKKKLTISETREQMALSGDVDGLWKLLSEVSPSVTDIESTFKLLARALDVRSQRDPAAFAAEVFGRMVGFTSYLMLRTHMYAHRLVRQHDHASRGFADLPRGLTDTILPQLLEMQQNLTEMLTAQASVARQWTLTRSKENELGGASGEGIQPDETGPVTPIMIELPPDKAEREGAKGSDKNRQIPEEPRHAEAERNQQSLPSSDRAIGVTVARDPGENRERSASPGQPGDHRGQAESRSERMGVAISPG
jgi:hypothetical protein